MSKQAEEIGGWERTEAEGERRMLEEGRVSYRTKNI